MFGSTNQKKFYIVFLFLFSGLFSNVFPGTFKITPSNLNSYSSTLGLIYSTEGNVIIDTDGTQGCTNTNGSFCTTTGSAKLNLDTFNIKNGQSWGSLKIVMTSGSGTVDIIIKNESGVQVKSVLAVNTDQTINLSQISELSSGAPFGLQISFSATSSGVVSTQIESITVDYSGNDLVCFPAPYQISSGNLKMAYEVTSASKVTLQIYDNRGKLVKTVLNGKSVTGTRFRYQNISTWDGKDDTGRVVNTGLYVAVIRVVPNATGDNYVATFKFLVIR